MFLYAWRGGSIGALHRRSMRPSCTVSDDPVSPDCILPQDPFPENWIGVDLNTTGHIAVIAHPGTGRIMKLGKNAGRIHAKYEKLRDNFGKHKKVKKLHKIENRESLMLQDLVTKISRQVVYCAQTLHAGIKLERIYGPDPVKTPQEELFPEYTITSRAFRKLQSLIESRAGKAGIPVVYVDPSFTSQKCSRCGSIGTRHRKKFECPHCGYEEHADVNAAFNIADSPFVIDEEKIERAHRHKAGQIVRQQLRARQNSRFPDFVTYEGIRSSQSGENIFCTLEPGFRR
ncbi:MAG: RNA-guided endonuclease TnpB family protein [Methanoregulaceae archaeon]